MDFKRIQIIFLVAFVIIDIVLFSSYRKNVNLQNESIINGSDSTVIKEMKNDQITVPSKISDDTSSGYYLAADQNDVLKKLTGNLSNQTIRFYDHTVHSTLKRPIAMYSKNVRQVLDKLILNKEFMALGDRYQYCSNLSTNNMIVYVQKAYNSIIFSNEAEIRFTINSQRMLTGYTQTYLDGVKPLREKSDTISEEKALTALYQYNEIPNNSKIIWTHLTYTRLVSIKKSYIYIPTWIIAIRNNNSTNVQLKYINAFTGSVINNSSLTDSISNN